MKGSHNCVIFTTRISISVNIVFILKETRHEESTSRVIACNQKWIVQYLDLLFRKVRYISKYTKLENPEDAIISAYREWCVTMCPRFGIFIGVYYSVPYLSLTSTIRTKNVKYVHFIFIITSPSCDA